MSVGRLKRVSAAVCLAVVTIVLLYLSFGHSSEKNNLATAANGDAGTDKLSKSDATRGKFSKGGAAKGKADSVAGIKAYMSR